MKLVPFMGDVLHQYRAIDPDAAGRKPPRVLVECGSHVLDRERRHAPLQGSELHSLETITAERAREAAVAPAKEIGHVIERREQRGGLPAVGYANGEIVIGVAVAAPHLVREPIGALLDPERRTPVDAGKHTTAQEPDDAAVRVPP